MKLFEVIFCFAPPGFGGKDCIYLLRAPDVESAGDYMLINAPGWVRQEKHRQHNSPDQIFEIGTDASSNTETKLLRGPYYQTAYNEGWKSFVSKYDSEQKKITWVPGDY